MTYLVAIDVYSQRVGHIPCSVFILIVNDANRCHILFASHACLNIKISRSLALESNMTLQVMLCIRHNIT